MNVLVTGGAGYIGAVLVRQLLERGHRVRIVDTMQFGNDSLQALQQSALDAAMLGAVRGPGDLDAFLSIREGDIREPDPRWFDGIDAVAHLAGFSNDPMADADPGLNHEVNVTGTRRIAEAAITAGIGKFTFGSSASIYDRGEASAICGYEVNHASPIGGYSTSKYHAEAWLHGLNRQHPFFKPVIFRQATVFGQSLRMRYDLVVNAMVRDAILKRIIDVHGDEELMRPLISVEAVARLHVKALEGQHGPLIVNAVGGNYTVADLAMAVAKETGAQVRVTAMPPERRVRNYRCSSDRLLATFGPSAGLDSLAWHIRDMRDHMAVNAYDARFENIAAMRKAGALA